MAIVADKRTAVNFLPIGRQSLHHRFRQAADLYSTEPQRQEAPTSGRQPATFAAVNAPFAPGTYRYENGQVIAAPDCTFA